MSSFSKDKSLLFFFSKTAFLPYQRFLAVILEHKPSQLVQQTENTRQNSHIQDGTPMDSS